MCIMHVCMYWLLTVGCIHKVRVIFKLRLCALGWWVSTTSCAVLVAVAAPWGGSRSVGTSIFNYICTVFT